MSNIKIEISNGTGHIVNQRREFVGTVEKVGSFHNGRAGRRARYLPMVLLKDVTDGTGRSFGSEILIPDIKGHPEFIEDFGRDCWNEAEDLEELARGFGVLAHDESVAA